MYLIETLARVNNEYQLTGFIIVKQRAVCERILLTIILRTC